MELETTEIKDICQQIADVYYNKMMKANYNPQGELMNFTWVTEYKGGMFELFFNLPDYWIYAEEGRRPGKFPPPQEILKWINFKHLVPKAGANGKVPSTSQLVYVVSKKIAEQGTHGLHLLQQTINETYDTLVDQLVEAISNEIEKELENEIEQI